MALYKVSIYSIIILFISIIIQYYRIKRLKKNITRLKKISDNICYVSENIIASNKEEDIYSIILNGIMNLFQYADKGNILIYGADGKYYFKAQKGFKSRADNIALKKEEIFINKINNFNETILIKKPICLIEAQSAHNFETGKLLEEYKDITCAMSSPIYIDEKLIGIINIYMTDKKHYFKKEDSALFSYMKSKLTVELKNSYIQSKLRYMANYDELTGIFNRRHFKQLLTEEIARSKRYNYTVCLVLIDLDDFKQINDNFGHSSGDNALKIFAEVLKKNIRNTDIYARMSGDEFVILFVNCIKEKVIGRMERLRNELSKSNNEKFDIDFSYGICQVNEYDEIAMDEVIAVDEMFIEADKEMYEDKRKKGAGR